MFSCVLLFLAFLHFHLNGANFCANQTIVADNYLVYGNDMREHYDFLRMNNTVSQSIAKIPIIHSMPFNGEPMSLLSIAYLHQFVDVIIVVESLETFSGKNKTQYALDRFSSFLKPYRDKIVELRIDVYPIEEFDYKYGFSRGSTCPLCWCKEAHTRNVIKKEVLKRFRDTPFILQHADGDELTKRSVMSQLPLLYDKINEWGGRVNVQSTKFTYSFKWFTPNSYHRSIFIITDQYWKWNPDVSLDMLRHSPKDQITHIFMRGAWHCTSCLTPEDIIKKLEAFSHQEYNKPRYKDVTKVQYYIARGMDVLERRDPENQCSPHHGDEGFPDLQTCPKCAAVPGYFDVLKIGEVALRAAARGYSANRSCDLERYQQYLSDPESVKKAIAALTATAISSEFGGRNDRGREAQGKVERGRERGRSRVGERGKGNGIAEGRARDERARDRRQSARASSNQATRDSAVGTDVAGAGTEASLSGTRAAKRRRHDGRGTQHSSSSSSSSSSTSPALRSRESSLNS